VEDPARTAGARIPVRLEMQRIELHAVLSESIETLRATAEAKAFACRPGWILCLIDPLGPYRLPPVFWNLIHNAINHLRARGCRVTIQRLLTRMS